ncbi:cation:proton antiporter [Streptomyces sp. NPDC087305]|uniref:cation:proton antiporter n=1 Tax=Streptomyces sp. NPDC087305 TaxID=3365781 RepID=UPI00381FBAD6
MSSLTMTSLTATAVVPPLDAHTTVVLLCNLGGLLAVAVLLGRLAAHFHMPPVVGELCAGVLLGPSLLAHLAPGLSAWLLPPDPARMHLLDAVGQLGVLLLTGMTGMQLDLGLVRRRGASAARISLFGIVLPLGLGVGAGFLVPGSLLPDTADRGTFAAFLGVAMGVSAIPVIAKTLTEMRLLHRDVGQLTLCAVAIDDIIGWILLSAVSAMATSTLTAHSLLAHLAWVPVILLAALLLRPPIRALLRAVTRSGTPGLFLATVTVLLLLAAAGTQAAGLEGVFGAFLCGVVIGSTGFATPERCAALTTVVLAVLAPLYFATAGLRVDLTALGRPAVLLTAVVVLALAVFGKFAGAYLGARLSRMGHWEGLALGAGMNARGVIEVIVAMVGLRLGVLSPALYTIVVLVAVITSLMAPPVLRVAMAKVEHTAEERLREHAAVADLSPAPSTEHR